MKTVIYTEEFKGHTVNINQFYTDIHETRAHNIAMLVILITAF